MSTQSFLFRFFLIIIITFAEVRLAEMHEEAFALTVCSLFVNTVLSFVCLWFCMWGFLRFRKKIIKINLCFGFQSKVS